MIKQGLKCVDWTERYYRIFLAERASEDKNFGVCGNFIYAGDLYCEKAYTNEKCAFEALSARLKRDKERRERNGENAEYRERYIVIMNK